MRRCIFKEFTRNKTTRWFYESTCEGNFIQYGVDCEEFECGVGNYTCLVIETDNGEVKLVPPSNVIKLTPPAEEK